MSTELVERERQWCLSCGTITRTGRCDCSDDSPEAQRLVNYADEVSSEARKLSEANTALTAKVALLAEALRVARIWHESEGKSLSPNGNQWAQHQEQMAEIDAALSEPDKDAT